MTDSSSKSKRLGLFKAFGRGKNKDSDRDDANFNSDSIANALQSRRARRAEIEDKMLSAATKNPTSYAATSRLSASLHGRKINASLMSKLQQTDGGTPSLSPVIAPVLNAEQPLAERESAVKTCMESRKSASTTRKAIPGRNGKAYIPSNSMSGLAMRSDAGRRLKEMLGQPTGGEMGQAKSDGSGRTNQVHAAKDFSNDLEARLRARESARTRIASSSAYRARMGTVTEDSHGNEED
jgi:hypothetical protein